MEVLISHGAWVKIVNNKGQSPRSLAVTHLKPSTLDLIEKAEEEQSDLPWLNFRESHSDGALYGDLGNFDKVSQAFTCIYD